MNDSLLNENQRKALREIIDSEPGFKAQGVIGEFLDLWLVCEVLVKKLIMYQKSESELPMNWQWTQVGPALRNFGIMYEDEKVKPAFSGDRKAKRGEKSARVLRNGYLHTLSKSDTSEIERRKKELLLLLEYWKQAIGNATSQSKSIRA